MIEGSGFWILVLGLRVLEFRSRDLTRWGLGQSSSFRVLGQRQDILTLVE